jgi:addiction module HigA family antidote
MSLLKLRPIHPGEILQEQLAELGMSARALAARLRVPTNRITAVLKGTRSVTPDTALRLAKLLGGEADTARFWLDLQQAYDLRRAELDAAQEGYLEGIVPVSAPERSRQRKMS